MSKGTDQRGVLGKANLAAAGVGAIVSLEERILMAALEDEKIALVTAFKKGADFMIVGMFDFQVADNVELAAQVVARNLKRKGRPWLA